MRAGKSTQKDQRGIKMTPDDRLRAAAEEYAFAGDDPAKLPDLTHAVLMHAVLSSARDGFLAGAKYERDRAEGLLEDLRDSYPSWFTCEEHDFEPNTTMDFFRCEKCGIRPKVAEAIAAYREL